MPRHPNSHDPTTDEPSLRGPEPVLELEMSLRHLPAVGQQRVEAFERLELRNVVELLRHFPRRYEDRRRLRSISTVTSGETVVLAGRIVSVRGRSLGGARHLLTVRLADDSGEIELVWFNRSYLTDWLREGLVLCVHGSVKRRRGVLQITSPDFEIDSGDDDSSVALHMNRLVPIYPLSRGLTQRFLRGLVARVLDGLQAVGNAQLFSPTPFDHFHPEGPTELEAYARIHFPQEEPDAETARSRFAFDERFAFASRLCFRRESFRQSGGCRLETSTELDRKIRSVFPFEFTAEQNRVVEEIVSDLRSGVPMYRLLQGDVGTGKTAIALYALLVAIRGGRQGALLAPTEVLTRQHLATIRRYLGEHPTVCVEMLTGSSSAAERRRVLAGLESGEVHVVVGTHALVQDAVRFRRLGLAIIDEQHRFGVRERRRVREKGERPHLLVMTATPIPRSLSMTCYGDLDLSLLRERPPGRKPVTTRLVRAADRSRALGVVRKQLQAGRQAFFIYPLVEESEALALPAAIEGHAALARSAFAEFRVGLLHGRMDAEEKAAELDRFQSGETRVLVATIVVEVGIDVPEASVIWLENGSRFGLAQLHQLRGRVGRGGHRGYCFVSVEGASKDSLERLRTFARIDDGFELAQEDLRRRGPGDYLGVRQSGRPRDGFGHPLLDLEAFLDVKTRAEAFWKRPENNPYRELWQGSFDSWLGPGGDGFGGED